MHQGIIVVSFTDELTDIYIFFFGNTIISQKYLLGYYRNYNCFINLLKALAFPFLGLRLSSFPRFEVEKIARKRKQLEIERVKMHFSGSCDQEDDDRCIYPLRSHGDRRKPFSTSFQHKF